MEIENKNSTWRIAQNSCWTQISIPQWGTPEAPTPYYILVPCEESSCCSIQIEVCNYGLPLGKNIKTIGDVIRDGDGCLNSYFYYHDYNTGQLVSSQCNDVCDEWLNELNEFFYAGGKIVYHVDKKIGTKSNVINYYIHNNFDTSIIFELIENQEIQLHIVDLIGQSVLNSSYNLKTGSNKIDLENLNLQSGIYFINVYSNSKLEISDKFIIMR